MNDINLSTMIKPAKSFLAHHHPIIFLLFTSSLLGIAIFMMIVLIQEPDKISDNLTNQASVNINFDKATIDRIDKLHQSSDSQQKLDFPADTRYNPFVEK